MADFTHINHQGNAKWLMFQQNITKRTAVAHSSIIVNHTIYEQIVNHTAKKECLKYCTDCRNYGC